MRTLLVLGAGVLAFVLAQTTVIPALHDLQETFRASSDWIAWMLTAYLLVGCIATPIFGRLGDMFGKQRLLTLSLVCFGVGSLVCATAPSLEMMIVGRGVQGLGGGVFPLSFGIVRDEFPPANAQTGIAVLGSLATIGGGLGLPLGGLLVDGFGYRSIFWVGAAMGLLAAAMAYLWVPESPVRAPARVDRAGALLLAAGLGALLIGISRSAAWGWVSGKTRVLVAAGLAILGLFGRYERHTAQPLINIQTFVRRPVLVTNASTVLIGSAMVGTFVLIPQIGQLSGAGGVGLGLSTTAAGLLLVPGSLLSMLGAPLIGRATARFGPKLIFVGGCVITAAGLFGLAAAHGSVPWVVAWACLTSVGLGCAFGAIPNLIVAAVDSHETGEATATNTVMRNIGLALGSQIAGTVLAAHALRSGAPTNEGFVVAFVIGAVGVAGAALSALLLPRRV